MRGILRTTCLHFVTLGLAIASGQVYVNDTASTGITIPPPVAWSQYGRGCAWEDFDGDGDLDLFAPGGPGHGVELWWNDGTGSFNPQSLVPFDGTLRLDHGCAAADFDNDGDQDVYLCVGQGAPNMFFVNFGGGVFVEMAAAYGIDHAGDSYAAAWGDFDRDGLLDLVVGDRLAFGPPGTYADHHLFRNTGLGSFADVTAVTGVACPSMAFVTLWHDVDGDGWQDLLYGNDKALGGVAPPNTILRNRRDGTFTDVGAALNADVPIDCMGLTAGDVDLDGDWDLFMTNNPMGHVLLLWDAVLGAYASQVTWYDAATTWGIPGGQVGWSCRFLDYDNDGIEDLFVAHETGINRLLRGTGFAPFLDVSVAEGLPSALPPGIAACVVDLDGDGRLDLWHAGDSTFAQLARHTGPAGNHITIDLVGSASNRDGLGARLLATSASGTRMRQLTSGEGYLADTEKVVHFGLGLDPVVTELEIRWPSGTVQYVENLAVNQRVTITEPQTTPAGSITPGSSTLLQHSLPDEAGRVWAMGLSLDVPGELYLPDGRALRVDVQDPLLSYTTTPGNGLLGGFAGVVPASGQVSATLVIPSISTMTGYPFRTIAVTVDPTYAGGIRSITGPGRFVIQ